MLKSPTFATLIALAALSGCATSYVMVGQARPPISPDQVQIYLHPPANKYSEIALWIRPAGTHLRSRPNVVMERLKTEAAKLGANGILLKVSATKPADRWARGTRQDPATPHLDSAAPRPSTTRKAAA
jgi:hypothetical protein